jgi:hydroxymethylpyrimidine pyrophosphatase-like HAD family hydrolase
VLATGRRLGAAWPVAEALGLADPLIAANGALVLWGERAEGEVFPPATVVGLLEAGRRLGLVLAVAAPEPAVPDLFGDEALVALGVPRRGRLEEGAGRPVSYLAGFGPRTACEALRASAERLGVEAVVFPRPEPGQAVVECVPAGTSKAKAALRVMRRLGVAPAEAVAVGDGPNDLPLLAVVGLGVAMGNAVAEVRARAGLVLPDNTEAGLARLPELLAGKEAVG